jgi:lipopolysaccharide export system protein LptA
VRLVPFVCGLFLAGALAAAPAGAAAPVREAPFQISADNLTGGRGPDGDVVFLNGNIRVTRGHTLLTADNGHYMRANGFIDLTGHVRLVDSTTTVTCEHALFSENDDRLNLEGNVVIVDRDATLRAPAGWYDRRAGIAHLSGGVTGNEKQQRLAADEVTYLRDSLLVQARGHVKGWDDENKVELDAHSVDFFRRTRIAVATGDPEMRSREDDGRTTVLRAMLLRLNSATKVAEALDSVHVTRDTLSGRADYARFDDSTGVGVMLGSPRVWDDETVVAGDTIVTHSVARHLRRVQVRGHSVMDYAGLHEANAGETSRLSGARLDAWVDESRMDSLMATGQAHDARAELRARRHDPGLLQGSQDRPRARAGQCVRRVSPRGVRDGHAGDRQRGRALRRTPHRLHRAQEHDPPRWGRSPHVPGTRTECEAAGVRQRQADAGRTRPAPPAGPRRQGGREDDDVRPRLARRHDLWGQDRLREGALPR